MINGLIVDSDQKWQKQYHEDFSQIPGGVFICTIVGDYSRSDLLIKPREFDFYILTENNFDDKNNTMRAVKIINDNGGHYERMIVVGSDDPNDDSTLEEARKLGIATFTKNKKWEHKINDCGYDREIYGHKIIKNPHSIITPLIDGFLSGNPFIHYTK